MGAAPLASPPGAWSSKNGCDSATRADTRLLGSYTSICYNGERKQRVPRQCEEARAQIRSNDAEAAARCERAHRKQVAAGCAERGRHRVPLLQVSVRACARERSARCVRSRAESARALRCHCGKVLLKSGSCDTPGQDVSVGVPSVLQRAQRRYASALMHKPQHESLQAVISKTYRKILNSSSISESPGKSGRWLIISTKMQPMDLRVAEQKRCQRCEQTTSASRYCCARRVSGGARAPDVHGRAVVLGAWRAQPRACQPAGRKEACSCSASRFLRCKTHPAGSRARDTRA
jgi:hypothetical protein